MATAEGLSAARQVKLPVWIRKEGLRRFGASIQASRRRAGAQHGGKLTNAVNLKGLRGRDLRHNWIASNAEIGTLSRCLKRSRPHVQADVGSLQTNQETRGAEGIGQTRPSEGRTRNEVRALLAQKQAEPTQLVHVAPLSATLQSWSNDATNAVPYMQASVDITSAGTC